MNPIPFQDMDANFAMAFGNGIQASVTALLTAVRAPLMACVTLWTVVQGVLVMRGDMDPRGGITRILKVAFVVGLLTSSGLYTTYVQTLFITTIPNWFASVAGSSQSAMTNTPAAMDNMWQVIEHTVESIGKHIAIYDALDAFTLSLVELFLMGFLLVTFAIYEFSVIATGIMVAIGPVMIAGYLFETTKGVTDRWIGKLISYSLLTLLINVTLTIILQGEKAYMRTMLTQQAEGLGGVPMQLKLLIDLLMFFAMGAFIMVSLPAIAAVLGGGLGVSPGAAVMNMITTVVSSSAKSALPPPRRA